MFLTLPLLTVVSVYIVAAVLPAAFLMRYIYRMIVFDAVNAAVTLSTGLTGWTFFFDAQHVYHRGPFYQLSMAVMFAMALVAEAFVVFYRKQIDRRLFFALFFFLFPPLIGGVLQAVLYGLPYTLMGVVLSLLIVFVYSQNCNMNLDYLTGAYNRRWLDIHMQEAVDACRDDGRPFAAIMYLHGGGYVSGDGEYADWVAGLLAVKLGIRVYPAAYGLAPERPYPAAVDDAERAYRALLARETPERIALYGDSSGGGLCFALLLRLKQAAVPLPAAVAASSPWTDLTLRALPPEGDDGLLSVPVLREWAALYAAGAPLDAPELSPVYGELSGLPPALLLAGGGELVRSDSERLHSALLAAGVSSELCVAPGMWHTYPLSGVRESRRAMEQTAAFLAARLSPGPSA